MPELLSSASSMLRSVLLGRNSGQCFMGRGLLQDAENQPASLTLAPAIIVVLGPEQVVDVIEQISRLPLGQQVGEPERLFLVRIDGERSLQQRPELGAVLRGER